MKDILWQWASNHAWQWGLCASTSRFKIRNFGPNLTNPVTGTGFVGKSGQPLPSIAQCPPAWSDALGTLRQATGGDSLAPVTAVSASAGISTQKKCRESESSVSTSNRLLPAWRCHPGVLRAGTPPPRPWPRPPRWQAELARPRTATGQSLWAVSCAKSLAGWGTPEVRPVPRQTRPLQATPFRSPQTQGPVE